MVAFDIAAAEVVDVGVPEAGEAAEEKDVADSWFPEPSRGDRTRFTILILSAEMPCRAFCGGFFVSSVSKSVTKTVF